MSHSWDLTFEFQAHIWSPWPRWVFVCFGILMSSHCGIQQRLPNWLAWKINASLNSIFVFVWYLANTGANPAWWEMFNWCSHMTMLETEGEKNIYIKKKGKKQQEEANLKVFSRSAGEWIFLVQAKKWNHFFFLSCCQVPCVKAGGNTFHCTTTVMCHKHERQTHQLSNISHKTLFAKAITGQDQILCSMACSPAHAREAGWYSGEGKRASEWASERLPGWLSPGESQQWAVNKLLWRGKPAASLPPLKPAWHRPGSRWPLAGLACSCVHYRAAMDKKNNWA